MIETQESITAKLCSFARAHHSYFGKEKIFDDYLAFDMMGREEYERVGYLIENDFENKQFDPQYSISSKRIFDRLNTYISPIPLSRIAFAEKELLKFAEESGECQYVICGAGMDTFSFRNGNSKIKVFELDHPDTQKYKLEKIKKLEWNIPENVKYVPIDFSKDDMIKVLYDAGFDVSVPTFFSILGVTYYLTLPVFEQTVEKISKISKAKSKLVFDFPDESTFDENAAKRVKRLAEITAKLGEPMLHGFSVDEIKTALWRHGFEIEIHETPKTIQNKFFGARADGQKAFENIHFILSVKKENNK